MVKIAKITGGAGTQKTSHLIRQIEKDLQTYFMRDIAAVSLTKAAMKTIKTRLVTAGVGHAEMSNIGTIHSLCFGLVGCPEIADLPKNITLFNEENPKYAISSQGDENNKGLFDQMQYCRNRMLPESKWKHDVRQFWGVWQSWMEENGLMDFTGLLEECLKSGRMIDSRVIYVDETQDQTPLATAVINQWGGVCDKVSFYGDDDQSLYRFSGAVPESFIKMSADYSNNRPQSYRVPKNILDYAMRVIRKCRKRIEKDYAPITPELLATQNEWRLRTGKAAYDYTDGILHREKEYPDLSMPGTHMILTRCNFQVNEWRSWLLQRNIPFCNPFRDEKSLNPADTKTWKALSTYADLLSGKSCTVIRVKQMVESCKAKECFEKAGTKKKFAAESGGDREYEQFGLLSEGFAERFIMPSGRPNPADFFKIEGQSGALAKWLFMNEPEKLSKPPAVIIGTVHSVKGAEAENVWFDVGSSPAIQRAVLTNQEGAWDDECRVAYVAITRARRSFGLLSSNLRNLVI